MNYTFAFDDGDYGQFKHLGKRGIALIMGRDSL